MNNAALGNAEPQRRPRREHRLPAYLDDYQVGFQPSVPPDPLATVSRSSSHHSSNPSRSSYTHSRSSRRTCYSVGTYPTQGLSTAQAAILEERIKQLELEDTRRMIEHETQADLECKLLDDQAKEAQRLQDEALKAREALKRQLEREQRLTRAQQELEIAKLRSSLLSNSWTPALSVHSDKSDAFLHLSSPVQADMLPSAYQSSLPTQLISTPAPVVRPHIPPPQVMQQGNPVSTAPPTGPQPMLQPAATPANPTAQPQRPVPMAPRSVRLQPGPALTPTPVIQPVPHPSTHVITSLPLAHITPQVASSFVSQLPSGPAPAKSSDFNRPPANPVESPSSTVYQPAYGKSQPIMEQLKTAPTSQGAPPLFSTHHGHQTAPVFSAPYPGYAPLPGAELLLATALEIPRPSLPVFESGWESDVLGSNVHLSEQYKYQVLIGHIKPPSALQLAKVYMHDWHHIQVPCRLYKISTGSPDSSSRVSSVPYSMLLLSRWVMPMPSTHSPCLSSLW